MAALVLMAIAMAAVVLVLRAAAVPSGPGGVPRPGRPARRRRSVPGRPMAPDDDPEFIRELERRARREGGTTS